MLLVMKIKNCYSHLQTGRRIVRNEIEIRFLVQQICEVRCHIEGVVNTRCSSKSIRTSSQSENYDSISAGISGALNMHAPREFSP